MAVHPNNHPFDSPLIASNTDGVITGWLNKEDYRKYYNNTVNTGIHILSTEILKNNPQSKEKIDLDRDALKPSIPSRRIFAYNTPEYIKDMGIPERYDQVTDDIKNGMVRRKNLSQKQKAVFLDRDGTINKLNGFIKQPNELVLLDGAAEAIKTINRLGYLVIVITNQPVIARGEVNIETLELIHIKMGTELGKHGAFIDDLFYCPHHPDRGFQSERPEYKIDCECRKPKPGMILAAAKKYNIDLTASYMADDDIRDAQAGINAGCIPVLITDKANNNNNKKNIILSSVMTFSNISEFTLHLTNGRNKTK